MDRIKKVIPSMRIMLNLIFIAFTLFVVFRLSRLRSSFWTKWIARTSDMALRFPDLKTYFWTKIFNIAADILNDRYIFMNLGYASLASDADEYSPKDIRQLDSFSEQLYRHVIGKITIQGKDILEVGCGRGGGSAYIMQHWNPQSLTAVDIAHRVIERCKIVHTSSGIHFQQADAMALPFSSEQFDVVINIESSHCYPSRQRFFKEIFRILRPGGFFLYADLVSMLDNNLAVENVHQLLKSSGLLMIQAQDITENVLKSRDLLTQSDLFEDAIDKLLREEVKPYRTFILPAIKNGYYLAGTESYRCLKDGMIVYWSWILQKPMLS